MSTVHHPSHYHAESGIEVIDVIQAWGLGFCGGNAVKYIARHHRKGRAGDDIDKAIWYLQRGAAGGEVIVRPQTSAVPDAWGMCEKLTEAWGLPDALTSVLTLIMHGSYSIAFRRLRALQQAGQLPTSGAWEESAP